MSIVSDVSKRIEIKIPTTVVSTYEGYELLCKITAKTSPARNAEIRFDFSDSKFFEANLCSPFGALLEWLKERKNSIELYALQEPVKGEFEKNGFNKLLLFQQSETNETNDSITNIKKFTLSDTITFQDYINDQLLGKEDFPHLSPLLKKKINKSIFEIFNNAHTHGRSDFVYTCGKYSPKQMKLKFTISDMGRTIRKNVNDYFKSGKSIPAKDAIAWAVQEGNTTKEGNIPGGLGLSLIRDFLGFNEGAIQIISSNGYWEEKNGAIFDKVLQDRYLGTIVNLEFNMNDSKSYILTSEIDPKNVL